MINSKLIKKYYDKRAACQVLGCLMKEPHKVKDKENNLIKRDFSSGLHQIIFISIYNLAYQGIKEISITEIENYLSSSSPINYKKVFEENNGLEWLTKVLDDANLMNYTYYYQKLKKMSLLRSYLEQGINISEILNVDEIDPIIKQDQQDKFDEMTLADIIRTCDKKVLAAKKDFVIKDDRDSRKAGEDAEELYEKMKESPMYGLGFESNYLNSITRGMLKGNFLLETRDTGCGKTRIALKRLIGVSAPRMWSFTEKKFIKNPNGSHPSLYIGTEMDLYDELEPMMWAIVSGVDESKIKDCALNEDEDIRVKEAIKILKDTPLFLEHEPNFNISYLWQIAEEYKVSQDIYAIAVDYIELNSGLIAEFTNNKRGMNVREDQILLDLSKNIKEIAEKIDIFINCFTQTTDEARRDGVRDQRAVKGARSLPNKCDFGIVSFEPTLKELEKLDSVLKRRGIAAQKYPNICYSFYKNRSSRYKDIKIWGYQDLGTLEYFDLFCTDKDYKTVNINPTKIEVIDNKITINT